MRFWRIENMDDYASQLPPVRNTEMIRLVDGLPDRERFVMERMFFGQAALSVVAKELDVSKDTVKKIRANALRRLRGYLC